MNLANEWNPVPKPNRANFKTLTCSLCGVVFQRELGQWNRGFEKYYCSDDCARRAKRKGEYRKCLNCSKEFYTSPSRNKKYCSKKCDSIGNPRKGFMTSPKNSGKNNGQYKHGKYVGKGRSGGDTSKAKVRNKVIERDGGNWCALCGQPGPGLHLHRIVYGSQGGKYEVSNCVQLCAQDHEKVHTDKNKWMPHLLDLIKGNEEHARTYWGYNPD